MAPHHQQNVRKRHVHMGVFMSPVLSYKNIRLGGSMASGTVGVEWRVTSDWGCKCTIRRVKTSILSLLKTNIFNHKFSFSNTILTQESNYTNRHWPTWQPPKGPLKCLDSAPCQRWVTPNCVKNVKVSGVGPLVSRKCYPPPGWGPGGCMESN